MPSDLSLIRVVARRELRAHRRTFFAWAIPLGAMLMCVCALQPSVSNGLLAAKIEALPESMRRAFGMELVDFARPAGYLATNFLNVILGTSLFGGLLGCAVIAKEETLHTAELLYSHPAGRAQILLGKTLAVVLYVMELALLLGVLGITVLAMVVARPLELPLLASMFAGAAALGVCFAGIGMAIGATVRTPRSAGGLALAAILGTYAAGVISALSPYTAPLAWLSPYKLLEPLDILAHGGAPLARVLALLGIGVLFGGLAIVRYQRRDLHG